MGDTQPFGQLPLRKVDIAQQFEFLDQSFVLCNVNHDRCTATPLGEYQGTFGLPDLSQESRRVCAELGQRADVFLKVDSSHCKTSFQDSLLYLQ